MTYVAGEYYTVNVSPVFLMIILAVVANTSRFVSPRPFEQRMYSLGFVSVGLS